MPLVTDPVLPKQASLLTQPLFANLDRELRSLSHRMQKQFTTVVGVSGGMVCHWHIGQIQPSTLALRPAQAIGQPVRQASPGAIPVQGKELPALFLPKCKGRK